MRVLLSPPFLGGTGGMERAVHDMTKSFVANGHRVDIWAPKVLPGTWGVDDALFHRVPAWRGRGGHDSTSNVRERVVHALRPVRRALSPRYDLHIGFRWTLPVAPLIRADQHWVNPSGVEFAPEDLRYYDAVAMQAPDNIGLVPAGTRTVLLPPPLLDLAAESESVAGLPDEYVLTVFNARHGIKGGADLGELLERSPLPVVWCTAKDSPTEGVDDRLLDNPRLIQLREPSRGQLRHLYEHAYAYVSLSLTEGFGWAIADALRYTPRVVARRVGVMTFDEALQRGVHVIGGSGISGIDWDAVSAGSMDPEQRDLEWLSAASFCRRIEHLLG